MIGASDERRRGRARSSTRSSTSSTGWPARLGVLREVTPRWLDAIAATGEILSSRIVAAALTSHGLAASWVDARKAIVTGPEHTAAPPLMAETATALAATVDPLLAERRIPVIGGFVGATREGVTTTLGRGGSDYSAAIVGACLGASEIQIWTDVDGMLTADPRIVQRRPGRAAPLVRRGVGARVLRREGAAPGDDSAGGRPEHPGPHSQLAAAAGRARHAHHARSPGDRSAAHRRRLEEGRDGRGHHVHAHAHGARLSRQDLRRRSSATARRWTSSRRRRSACR